MTMATRMTVDEWLGENIVHSTIGEPLIPEERYNSLRKSDPTLAQEVGQRLGEFRTTDRCEFAFAKVDPELEVEAYDSFPGRIETIYATEHWQDCTAEQMPDGLAWYLPPVCGGQIVEVSYAAEDGIIYRHANDRSDGEQSYAMRLLLSDEEFEPWNEEPE